MKNRLEALDRDMQLLVLLVIAHAVFQLSFNFLGPFRLLQLRQDPCYAIRDLITECTFQAFGPDSRSFGYRFTLAATPLFFNTLVPLAGAIGMIHLKRWGWWLAGGFFVYWHIAVLRSTWGFLNLFFDMGGISLANFSFSVLAKQLSTLSLAMVSLLLMMKPNVMRAVNIENRKMQDVAASLVGIGMLLYASVWSVSFVAAFIWVW